MNFYLGTNLETLNPNHYNIRIDEEVCKYLYKNKINTNIRENKNIICLGD